MNHSNAIIKRLCCILLCGCLFASMLPSPAHAEPLSDLSKRGGAFRVLEIVDDMKDAAVGWYISGQEPVDFAHALRSALSGTERREYMTALGTALQSRGLSGGEDCPLAFEPYREALPWEEHEGMDKLTLDHTEFASVRGAFAALSGGGWSKDTEDGAEYVYMGDGAGEFTFLPSQYSSEVALCYYTVYTEGGCQNREFFKRAAFGLTYAQCGGVRVELSTRTAAEVTEEDIDAADLVLLCGEEISHGISNYIVISGKASAEYPEGFSTAPVNAALYSLCADVTPVALMEETGREVTVLDIEPRTATPSIQQEDVVDWFASGAVDSAAIECMSVAEFIGRRDDLIGTYDLIYIGASGMNIPLSGDGAPKYNDASLNGFYYSATGDRLTAASEERYTPFDLTEAKRAELVRYVEAGYPVVVADKLLETDGGTTFSVTITENKRLFRPTTYTAEVTFDDPASAPPLSDIRYQWYRSSGRLDKKAAADTYIKGSNDLIETGSFQCGVTIGGSTAYSNAIGPSGSGSLPRSDGSFKLLSTVRSSAVDPLSKMYLTLNDIKDSTNVLTVSAASAASAPGFSPVGPGLRVTDPDPTISRFPLSPTGTEVVSTDEEGEPVTADIYSMTFYFTLETTYNYTAKLYIDKNLDDSFLQSEEVTGLTMNPLTLVASPGLNSLTYEFPVGTAGLIPWKLVVTDGTHCDTQTGYAYIEPEDTPRTIRVLYRDVTPSGALNGGDGFTFTAASGISDCDVLVLSAGHDIIPEEQQYIDNGGAVVYLKDSLPSASENARSVYIQMRDASSSGAVSYVDLLSAENPNRYSTNTASVTNEGAVLRYPNDITGLLLGSDPALVTTPANRLALPLNANVKLCLTNNGSNGEAFGYIPNDVRNDCFLYTFGNSVYLGLDADDMDDLSGVATKLLSNAAAWAFLSLGGESSVKFVHSGTQDVMHTMYFPADNNGLLLPNLRANLYFYITMPDGEGIETTKLTISYKVNGVEIYSISPVSSFIAGQQSSYPIDRDTVLAALARQDTRTATVTVTLEDNSSATMNLQRFNLLPIK